MSGWLVAVGGLVLGLAGVAWLAVVEWAAWVVVLPDRRPGAIEAQGAFDTDPRAPGRGSGEPIEAVAADGVRLAGVWHPAEGAATAGRRRVVLLIHGFAEDPTALQVRAAVLNRRGWDVAALDSRAHGRSGGDRGSFGGREARDVSGWVDALAASGRLGGGASTAGAVSVSVWGRSMGAAVALRAAADDPRVAALVLEAPYLDLEATLRGVLRRKRVPLSGLLARRVMRRAGALAGVPLATPRPIDLAPGVATPALVVHGSDDPLVPSDDARRLAAAFPRPAAFVEVGGAGHNSVVEVGGSDLLDRIVTFLDAAADARG